MDTVTTAPVVAPSATPADETDAMLRDVEIDVLTGFTLADAMRAGCALAPQAHGSWGQGGEACALTTAALAARAAGYLA